MFSESAFHKMTKEQVRMLADRKYQTNIESDAFVSGWEYSQTNTKVMSKKLSQEPKEVLIKWTVITLTIVMMIETVTILSLLLAN